MAVRVSLGASQWRLIRQLLTENLFLGVAGGLAGLLVAYIGQDIFNFVIYQEASRAFGFQLDWRVLAYALLASLLTGLLFGMVPTWQISRLRLNDSLKETGWSASPSAGKRRFH